MSSDSEDIDIGKHQRRNHCALESSEDESVVLNNEPPTSCSSTEIAIITKKGDWQCAGCDKTLTGCGNNATNKKRHLLVCPKTKKTGKRQKTIMTYFSTKTKKQKLEHSETSQNVMKNHNPNCTAVESDQSSKPVSTRHQTTPCLRFLLGGRN